MKIREVMTTDPATGEVAWTGIQLLSIPENRRQHIPQVWIDKHTARGFATLDENKLTMHTIDGDMAFTVDHSPGRFCCHCGEALANEDQEAGGGFIPQGDPRLGAVAREHVASKHAGIVSPDPQNPSGYKDKMYYGLTAAKEVPTDNPNAYAGV